MSLQDTVTNISKIYELAKKSIPETVFSEKITIIYDAQEADVSTKTLTARISARVITQKEDSICGNVEEFGKMRYRTAGILSIQLFGPKTLQASLANIRQAAQETRKSLTTTFRSSPIWLQEISAVDIPQSDDFYTVNVSATFTFDEII